MAAPPAAWPRWLVAALFNVAVLVVMCTMAWVAWDDPWPATAFFGLVTTVFWWAFVLHQWRRR